MKKDDVMASGSGVSPRKAMAMDNMPNGGFDVKAFADVQGNVPHADHVAGTGRKAHMADSERGAGPGVMHTKGMHPAQAAPNHGPVGVDHFRRDKLA